MIKKKFSVGYNHDISMLNLIEEYKEYISYFYFPIPEQLAGSGRLETHPPDHPSKIDYLISFCNENKIKSMLLLNSQCDGELLANKKNMRKVLLYIDKLYKKGLKAITVTNLLYVKYIKRLLPDLEIHSSVNCYVKDLEHAKYLEKLGVDVITIDRDINYRISEIAKMKRYLSPKLTIMLNEGCLRNCPFRITHFNAMAHKIPDKEAQFFEDNTCTELVRQNPELFFRLQIIRPEDLELYDDMIDCFKIVSRDDSTKKIKEMLQAYCNRSFEGNLLNVVSGYDEFSKYYIDNKKMPNDFVKKMNKCDNMCDNCNYCKKLAQELLIKK